MKIVVIGLGVAGLHYIDILKEKKNTKIFVIDEKKILKSNNYIITSFKEIEEKNLFFDYAIIASPSGLHLNMLNIF